MFERSRKSLLLIITMSVAILVGCGKSRTAQDWHDQGMMCLTLLSASHDATGEKAIDHFSRAIKKDPAFVKSYNCRGVAYIQCWIKTTVLSAENLEELKKGVPLDPKTQFAQQMIGNARADFQKALELDPKYDLARNNLEKLNQGEYGEASGVEY